VLPTSVLSLDAWHHVAIVYSNSFNSVQVFVDGNPDCAEGTFPSPNATTQAPLNIGSDTPAGTYDFNGIIDDIRICNRALSSTEVSRLHAVEYNLSVDLVKAVKPSFANLFLGTNYQLLVSTDLNTWTNSGPPFTSTNTVMDCPQYLDVENWGELFFRLQVSP